MVVFTTDHGEYAGEHGFHGKNALYETAYRIPLIIHWPAGLGAGVRLEHMLSTVDFQPTLLDLLGVPACGREQGRSAAGLLRGQAGDWDDVAFLHHPRHDRAGIFTPAYELALVRDGGSILFDRVNDPDQTHNLFGDRAHAQTVAALSRRVVSHHTDLGTPAADWLQQHLPASG